MPMDRQAIFTKAYLGLKAQNFERSMAAFAGSRFPAKCAYRGDGGKKCALGHCIPDEQYKPYFEGLGVAEPTRYESRDPYLADKIRKSKEIGAILGVETESDSYFLGELQSIHDNSSESSPMKENLEAFAARNGLTVPQDS